MKLTDANVRATMVDTARGDAVGVVLLIELSSCRAVRCEGDGVEDLARSFAEVSAKASPGTTVREVVYGLPPHFDPIWTRRPKRRHTRTRG